MSVHPLLLVEDLVVGSSGLILLPAVDRAGLHVEIGDVVDLVDGEKREEVRVLGLEPDRDPARVRLRVAASVLVAPGTEVWPSQSTSRVVVRRRTAGAPPQDGAPPDAAGIARAGEAVGKRGG
jgi:hypothetical protein